MWYNIYYITMKQSEWFTGLGGGTRQLHQKHSIIASSFDGAEIGSTGSIAMWSYPDVSSVNANKTLNANDNFAPQEFAQAA